jgi:hypothetical protein
MLLDDVIQLHAMRRGVRQAPGGAPLPKVADGEHAGGNGQREPGACVLTKNIAQLVGGRTWQEPGELSPVVDTTRRLCSMASHERGHDQSYPKYWAASSKYVQMPNLAGIGV